jgi:hypothetical protein
MIASLIINPATGKQIDEELLAIAFADEIKQAQAKYDPLCSETIVARMKAGSDAMVALWARNKFGWDRPGQTMTFSLPNANGDLGEEGKISCSGAGWPPARQPCPADLESGRTVWAHTLRRSF